MQETQNLWDIHKMEYHLAMKRNENSTEWMNVKSIMQSEISQTQKFIYYTYMIFEKRQNYRDKKQINDC